MSSKPFLGRIAGRFCRSSIFVGLRSKVHSTRIGGDFTQFFPGRILTCFQVNIWSADGKNLGVLMMRWLDVCCYSYEASNSFCVYSIYLEHKWNMYIYYIYTLHDMNFPGVLHKFSPNKKMQKKNGAQNVSHRTLRCGSCGWSWVGLRIPKKEIFPQEFPIFSKQLHL